MSNLSDAQLIQALVTADLPLMGQWLVQGGNADAPLPPEGLSPLALVARASPPQGVEAAHMLLKAGARPHVDSGRGATALHWAVSTYDATTPEDKRQRLALLDCLLEVCAEHGTPWPQNSNRWGVLHCATLRNKPELILHLLERGADGAEADGQGDTPLHVAYRGRHLAAAQVLHRFFEGAAPRNQRGQTPIEAMQAKHRMSWQQAERFALEAATPPAAVAARRQRL